MPASPYLPTASRCFYEGQELDVRVIPLTAHPILSPASPILPGAGQADFLLAALATRSAAGRSSFNCTPSAAPTPGAHRLVIAQYWNWHAAAASGHLGALGLERVRAHYAALAAAMAAGSSARAPRALLMAASEWAVDSTLDAVQRLLADLSVPTGRTCLVHFNHGVMRASAYRNGGDCAGCSCSTLGSATVWGPLRRWEEARGLGPAAADGASAGLCQVYWHSNLWLLAAQKRPKGRHGSSPLCARRPAKPARGAPPDPTGPPLAPAPFLLLGGKPRFLRGLVMLDLQRRGLLLPSRTRWSASRYAFCADAARAPDWAGQHGLVQALVAPGAPAPGWPAPYTLEEQRRLLGDRVAVEAFCALLPRVLDHPPGDTAYLFASSDALWRGVRFALTFESDMAAADPGARLAFLTEKSFKPLQHGLPFLMLGSPGSLATLRSLGFRTFAPAVNESYDDLLDGSARLRAVLREVERLAAQTDAAWEALLRPEGPLAAAVRHNQRQLSCGALKRVVGALAAQLLLPLRQACPPAGGVVVRVGGSRE